jgi:hypothetical protein
MRWHIGGLYVVQHQINDELDGREEEREEKRPKSL